MGVPALRQHGEDVTARAVELVLETAARYALAAAGMTPVSARTALTVSVAKMRTAGILHPQVGALQAPVLSPAELEATIMLTLDAPPLLWDAMDRPVAAGAVGFSAGGYISRLARAADPLDPLGTTTAERAQRHDAIDRRAQTLAAAVGPT